MTDLWLKGMKSYDETMAIGTSRVREYMKNKKSWILIVVLIVVVGAIFFSQNKKQEVGQPAPLQGAAIAYDEADRELIFGDASDEEINEALNILSKEYWDRAEVEESPVVTAEDVETLGLSDTINVKYLDKLSFELHREPSDNAEN